MVGDLALFGGGNGESNYSARVDVYNSTSGTWSNKSLSEACNFLAATTVGDLALFGCGASWSTASLSQTQGTLSATLLQKLAIFGCGGSQGRGYTRVDIYNSTSGTWSTATLSLRLIKILLLLQWEI